MDTKLLEDLEALRRLGSYVAAAEERHVTHPAFGRRIRALEAWAGVPLLQRGRAPVRLTPAGELLLDEALPLLASLSRARTQWGAARNGAEGRRQTLRVGTGRTLAHTWVSDWLSRLRPIWRAHCVELRTASMAEISAVFERGEVDLLVCYEHPALSTNLSGQRFRHATLAVDSLVPVSAVDANRRVRHELGAPAWIDYAPGLALGRVMLDYRRRNPAALPPPAIACDSADAMLSLVRRGLGLAWLPRSLVARDVRHGLLKVLGTKVEQMPFEVRIYRPRARQDALIEAAWEATAR